MEEEIIIIEEEDEQEVVIIEDDVEILSPSTQEKVVTPTKEQQVLIPDDGFTGLSKVTVEGVKLQNKSISPTSEKQTIVSDSEYLGLNEVVVNAIPSDYVKVNGTLNIDSNGEYDVKEYEKANVEIDTSSIMSEYFETTTDATSYMPAFIKKVPNLDISARTTLNNFFDGFSGIEKLPNLDLSKITNMSYMCQNCSSLKGLLTLNTPSCENFNYMFSGAFDVTSHNIITMEDMSKATNMNSMFENANVTEVVFNNTQNVTNMRSLFRDAQRLKSITGLDTSSCTNISQIFYVQNGKNRPDLTEIPQMDTSKVTDMSYICYGCKPVITIPKLNAESCINLTSAFYSCSSLVNFGGLKDLGKAYLTTASANNSNYTLTLNNSNTLSHDSLMNVINGLYDIASLGVQPQRLNIGSTNIAKLTEEEIAIATNKGWSVL